MIIAIPIGDPTGVGHGNCETFHVSTTGTLGELQTAYKRARVQWPEFSPDAYCNEDGARAVPADILSQMMALDFPLSAGDQTWALSEDGSMEPDARVLVKWICWFIRLGNSTLQVEPTEIPSLRDPQNQLTWGYGLYGQ